jgi:hypothetical protein
MLLSGITKMKLKSGAVLPAASGANAGLNMEAMFPLQKSSFELASVLGEHRHNVEA